MNQKDLIRKLFGNNDFRMTYVEEYQHEVFQNVSDSIRNELSKILPDLPEDKLTHIQEYIDGSILTFHEYGFRLGIDLTCSLLGIGAPFENSII